MRVVARRRFMDMRSAEREQVVDREITGVGEAAKAEVFRRLATDHLASGYRLARAILGSQAEAEDATHDAFVQAWRKWSSLRDPDRFEAWFERILVNTCRDRLRRRSRQRVTDLSGELVRPGPDPYGQVDERAALNAALARLSPDHRVVVALRYYRDLSTRQIADRLGIREGTVSSRLHHALRQLHERLDRDAHRGATDA
jgi:RNA polymerase sigma-70 factor (ECF subfamily)